VLEMYFWFTDTHHIQRTWCSQHIVKFQKLSEPRRHPATVKVKFTLGQATKTRTVNRCIALLLF